MTTVAVLTGDLIRSTELTDEALHRARHTVLEAIDHLSGWDKGLLGSHSEFFRGDSWQALLLKPGYFLRAALFLRARLRGADAGWDTRIAVGVGGVSKVDRDRTSLSSGESFRLSGQALDRMGTHSNLVVATSEEAWPMLDPVAQLCSAIADEWTAKQAEVAALALVPNAPSQASLANRLGISQQAVSKALTSAKIGVIVQACAKVERLKWRRPPRLI